MGKIYKLTKKFRFEAAHRLAKGYVGKCSHIHGHSWNGTLELSVRQLDSKDMGVDFSQMGIFLKKIEEWLDHKIILQEDDHYGTALIDSGYPSGGIAWVVDNPTSETLARYIFSRAVKEFESYLSVSVSSVTIEETCTTSCTYTCEDYRSLADDIHELKLSR